MASSFKVEVLTPEGQVFADEVELVSTRTTTGSIGIKARHAPLMAILEPTELRLYKSESDLYSRSSVGSRIAISGACRALIPIEPVVVRVETISTSSEKTCPSGVRTSTWNDEDI